jgi:hypothetical protein
MKNYHYSYTTLLEVVTTIFSHQGLVIHLARSKALTWLLQGLLLMRQATLSAMGRGIALINEEKTLMSQLQRAHRLMKNDDFDAWELASALFGYATQNLDRVLIAADWTDDGEYKVLEASLVIEGRAIPLYCLAVHKDEYKGRQTTLELTLWYALMAMRREGQVLVVKADRGFAKFDWLGQCPRYPWMHLVVRLKANTILTWDATTAPLREWPLMKGERVEIEQALLGREQEVVSGVCLAHLGEEGSSTLYLACAGEDKELAIEEYSKRAWVEQQNRDLKNGFVWRYARLATAARIERLWVVLGLAFYISYCNESVQESEFAARLSRRYKDGRKDLSWLSLAKCAALAGKCEVELRPLAAQ